MIKAYRENVTDTLIPKKRVTKKKKDMEEELVKRSLLNKVVRIQVVILLTENPVCKELLEPIPWVPLSSHKGCTAELSW